MNIFDKLNTPRAVIAILVVIVAVNGFLLFQQRGNDEPASTETAQNTPTQSDAENAGSENADSENADSGSETSNAADSDDSGSEDSEDNAGGGSNDAETSGSSQDSETGTASEQEQNEQQLEESDSSNQSGENQEEEPQQEDGGSSDESPSNGDQVEPDQGDTQLLLAGLSGAFGSCEDNPKDCARSYISSNISDSRYLGGRVDLAAAPQSENSEVLYFESSELGVCEFERETYESPEGQNYIVILLGEGSVQSEEGNECIPTA